MGNTEANDQRWLKEIEPHLLGKTIVKLRFTTKEERELLGWGEDRALMIQLNDGTIFYPCRDDAGGEPGSIWGQSPEGDVFDMPRM